MLWYLTTHSAATLLSHSCSRCLSGCFGSKSKCSVDHLEWDHFHSGFGMVALVGARVQNPLNPFFQKSMALWHWRTGRQMQCNCPSGWLWQMLRGFFHRKILARWFLCLFVCLFVRMFAWCQFILNLNLPATAKSIGKMISYHMPELVNFMATTLCYLIGWNWIMTKAIKSHITGFILPHRTFTEIKTRLKTKKY